MSQEKFYGISIFVERIVTGGQTQGNSAGSVFWRNSSVSSSAKPLIFSVPNYLVPPVTETFWVSTGWMGLLLMVSWMDSQRAGFSYPDKTDWIPLSAFHPLLCVALSPNCFHSCSVILVYLGFVVTWASPLYPQLILGLHPCPFTVCGGGQGWGAL